MMMVVVVIMFLVVMMVVVMIMRVVMVVHMIMIMRVVMMMVMVIHGMLFFTLAQNPDVSPGDTALPGPLRDDIYPYVLKL